MKTVYLRLFVWTCLLPLALLSPESGQAMAAAIGATSPSAASQAPAAPYNWPQFAFDAQHSGNNTLETTLTAGNVAQLKMLYQVTLSSIADGAPVYASAVRTANGVKNLLFLTTKGGHLLARNAANGKSVWKRLHGPGACKINNGSLTCYTTSSPVLDPNAQFVYGYGLDGYVHKYQVSNGLEIKSGGWPELATRKPWDEKGSSALSLTTTGDGSHYLYVTNGGYPGDRGNYQGHVTTINLSDGTQHVFNALCSNRVDVHFAPRPRCLAVQGAIWARPGVVYDAATNRIYMATGNATFDPSKYFWGDTVFALNPDGTGATGNPLDSYTPTNYQALQDSDTDLGSTAPAILPVPASSRVRNLAVQSGKDGKLRLLNLDNLSGQGGTGHVGGEVGPIMNVPQGGAVLTQPAVWVNPADASTWVFVANDAGISGLQLTVDGNGTPSLQPKWTQPGAGSSPILANGVLYHAGSSNIRALDPTSGSELWRDTQIGGIHWESPIVANGVLYITDESRHLTAYALR